MTFVALCNGIMGKGQIGTGFRSARLYDPRDRLARYHLTKAANATNRMGMLKGFLSQRNDPKSRASSGPLQVDNSLASLSSVRGLICEEG